MLQRKKSPGSARKTQRATKNAKAKAAPVRRRFVITSSARRNAAKAPTPVEKSRPATNLVAEADKRVQNGHANGNGNGNGTAPQLSVDLTETIKTLLHLSQEHGYITYDDKIGRAHV